MSPPKAPIAPPIPTKRAVPFKSFSANFAASYIDCALAPIIQDRAHANVIIFFIILNYSFEYYSTLSSATSAGRPATAATSTTRTR